MVHAALIRDGRGRPAPRSASTPQEDAPAFEVDEESALALQEVISQQPTALGDSHAGHGGQICTIEEEIAKDTPAQRKLNDADGFGFNIPAVNPPELAPCPRR